MWRVVAGTWPVVAGGAGGGVAGTTTGRCGAVLR